MALIKCPECSKDVSDKAKSCIHCGCPLEETQNTDLLEEDGTEIVNSTRDKVIPIKSNDKKKKLLICAAIILIISIIIGISISVFPNKAKNAIDACIMLQDNLKDKNSLEIYSISICDKKPTHKTTIDYKYQVFIEYGAKNAYGGTISSEVLYLLTTNSDEYLINNDSPKNEKSYFILAQAAVNGVSGLWEPSKDWNSLSDNQIKQIEKKIKK